MNTKWATLASTLMESTPQAKNRWSSNPLPLLEGEAKALLVKSQLKPTTSNVTAVTTVLPIIKSFENIFSCTVPENIQRDAAQEAYKLLNKRSLHLTNKETYFNNTLKLWSKIEPEQVQKNILKIAKGTKNELSQISLPSFLYFLATWSYKQNQYLTQIAQKFYEQENNK